jgi:hypothetical protein
MIDISNINAETITDTLKLIAKLKLNYAMQIATLSELEQTMVSKVVEPMWLGLGADRQKLRDAGIRILNNNRCARCSKPLGLNGGEYIFAFEGRAWCAKNCEK